MPATRKPLRRIAQTPESQVISDLFLRLRARTPEEKVAALENLMRTANARRAVIIVTNKLKNPFGIKIVKFKVRRGRTPRVTRESVLGKFG